MSVEQVYGQLWLNTARKEGHRKGLPSEPATSEEIKDRRQRLLEFIKEKAREGHEIEEFTGQTHDSYRNDITVLRRSHTIRCDRYDGYCMWSYGGSAVQSEAAA